MTTPAMEARTIRREPYQGALSDRGVDWRAVVAGALAGFAVTLILTTLGTAIGITAGDAADGASGRAIGTGALIWWALTVIAAGLTGGWVVARTARADIGYNSIINGTLAWVVGVTILLFLLAVGVGTMVGGLGGGLGAAAAESGRPNARPADTVAAAEQAADIGKGAAWGLLISQLLGLGATIVGARMRREDADARRLSQNA